MPAGENAVPGKQGFQTTEKPAADLGDLQLAGDDEAATAEDAAIEAALQAELAARETAASKVDALVLKSLARRLRRRWPDAAAVDILAQEDNDDYNEVKAVARADGSVIPLTDLDRFEASKGLERLHPHAMNRDDNAELIDKQETPFYRVQLDDFADTDIPAPTVPSPHTTLYFDAEAVRQHFEDDDVDPLEGLSDKEIATIGERAIGNDEIYRAFHQVLSDEVDAMRADKGILAI